MTRVEILALASDGRQFVVERTGYRSVPPTKLHGRP